MEGGKLYILPNNKYVQGRSILDTDYTPLEGSQMIEVQPKENHMILWADQVYHSTGRVLNQGVVKYRISLMFSSWDKAPEIYKDHGHWSNYNPDFIAGTQKAPQPMEFNLNG